VNSTSQSTRACAGKWVEEMGSSTQREMSVTGEHPGNAYTSMEPSF